MTEPRELSLYRAGEELRRGNLSAVSLVESCLERIEQREGEVHAWAALHAEQALLQAERYDQDAARSHWHGPLHGLPLGVKDIFDVKGMETRAGTAAYPVRLATEDAVSVARLRQAGALFLGKTVTTAFAYGDANETCNAWNTAHTPGGSSSGSGASVADRMCLAALGSQTKGSVVRPAAFNGVVGFKSGYGEISVEGVIPLSWQMDHVGTLTRNVEDAYLLWHLLRDGRTPDWQTTRDKMPPSLLPRAPKRVWRIRGVFEEQAEPEMVAAMDDLCSRMADHGVEIVERKLPASASGIEGIHQIIMASDGATMHRQGFELDPTPYPPKVSEMIREGLEIKATDYVGALRHRLRLIGQMCASLADVDCALMPAAKGAAPEGIDYTGDPMFNTLSSLCGLPALGFPAQLTPAGLPLGLQLIGAPQSEDDLMALGAWCESLLGFNTAPR